MMVADRIGTRPRRLLIRLDRWLAGLGMMPAVAVLTGAAMLLAIVSASTGWLIAFGALPLPIPMLAGAVSALVACPIILHGQRLIKALERKKRELTGQIGRASCRERV